MRKEIVVCEHCGKEVVIDNTDENVLDNWLFMHIPRADGCLNCDLCPECNEKLAKLASEFGLD